MVIHCFFVSIIIIFHLFGVAVVAAVIVSMLLLEESVIVYFLPKVGNLNFE